MAKAQLTIEALITFAAFLAVLAIFLSAGRSVAVDAAGNASAISAQARADAAAMELNLLAGDGPFSSLNPTMKRKFNCTFSCGQNSVCCPDGNLTRSALVISGTSSVNDYDWYDSIPV